MKTQIITLESHDDLISVRDRLSWAKTPRILLVWPKYEKVTLRLLDLKVLQRQADSLGAQLGLVTRRANVRRNAESLGIPVFKSTTAAQKEPWPDAPPRHQRVPKPPRRDLRQVRDMVYVKEPVWRTSLLGRMIAFTVGVAAFIAVAGLFVPRAAVTLYPEEQTQSVIIPIAASESTNSVSVTGNIPAHPLSVIVSADQSLAVTNLIAVPKTKAQGIARFTNLSQGEVNILAGTSISTKSDVPVHFVTMHETLIKPGVDEFVDIPIEAVQPGTNGNVDAGTIITVDGPLGLSVAVTNPDPVTGGTDTRLIGATESDRTKLHETVLGNLRHEAETKMRAQILSTDLLLLDTLETTKIIEETYHPAEGQPGGNLNLKMQVEFTARYVLAKDMKQLSLAALDASIPDGFEPTDAAAFKPITDPSTDASGVTHFEISVTRDLLHKIDFTQVFSLVHGKKPEVVARELTSTLSLRKEPDISITPSWWRWLPLIPFNITVHSK